jgi:hypothetical protein
LEPHVIGLDAHGKVGLFVNAFAQVLVWKLGAHFYEDNRGGFGVPFHAGHTTAILFIVTIGGTTRETQLQRCAVGSVSIETRACYIVGSSKHGGIERGGDRRRSNPLAQGRRESH